MAHPLLILLMILALSSAIDIPDVFTKEMYPILSPESNTFYKKGIYNPSVLWDANEYKMVFRADGFGPENVTSVLGYAISGDGVQFTVDTQPLLVPGPDLYDQHGLEDPRVVELADPPSLDEKYVLTYVANSGQYNSSHIAIATSPDLSRTNWKKSGVVLQNTASLWDRGNRKAAVIVPEKIGGQYLMYYLGESQPWHTCVGAAFSDDLRVWIPHASNPLFCARSGHFDSMGVEPGATPIVVDEGYSQKSIVLIYNGWNEAKVHCTGWIIFQFDGVTIQDRCKAPIIHPTLSWEEQGTTPKVTFTEGAIYRSNEWWLYYGAADESIGLARAREPGLSTGAWVAIVASTIIVLSVLAALVYRRHRNRNPRRYTIAY